MTDFLLVHGALHRAWCWHSTIAELERRGHRAVAVDLPTEDATAGAARYAAVAAEAAAQRFDGPVVAVGHSMSGLVIALMPDLLEIDELVFLCSPLPVPGLSLADQHDREPDMFSPTTMPLGTFRQTPRSTPPPPEHVIATFYHDCPPELARLAVQHLRPQSPRPATEPSPVSAWPPRVPCRYVLARDDRVINPEWARREVPTRLGVQPIEIDGSHSPFHARPTELVDTLVAVRDEARSPA